MGEEEEGTNFKSPHSENRSLFTIFNESGTLFPEMTADFKALDIGYEVQRSFANKFFSNKNVAKGLIDNTSAALLDELYKLIKIYVSGFPFIYRYRFIDWIKLKNLVSIS